MGGLGGWQVFACLFARVFACLFAYIMHFPGVSKLTNLHILVYDDALRSIPQGKTSGQDWMGRMNGTERT